MGSSDKTTAGLLGYDSGSWNNLEILYLESYRFSDLSAAEQMDVEMLGMNEGMWDCFMNHYNGYYWSELQGAGVAQYYQSLGWNQNSWDNDVNHPATEDMEWDELSAGQQEAAKNLCFSKNAWEWVSLKWW